AGRTVDALSVAVTIPLTLTLLRQQCSQLFVGSLPVRCVAAIGGVGPRINDPRCGAECRKPRGDALHVPPPRPVSVCPGSDVESLEDGKHFIAGTAVRAGDRSDGRDATIPKCLARLLALGHYHCCPRGEATKMLRTVEGQVLGQKSRQPFSV